MERDPGDDVCILLYLLETKARRGDRKYVRLCEGAEGRSSRGTVRFRGIGTGLSEASKTVPILSFATQRGKQESSYFRQGNYDKT